MNGNVPKIRKTRCSNLKMHGMYTTAETEKKAPVSNLNGIPKTNLKYYYNTVELSVKKVCIK